MDLLDPVGTVRRYEVEAPDEARRFGRGEIADAAGAVPGWSIPVDELCVT